MATLSELNDAQTAYHKLLTGVSPRVVVDSNGERVEFTAASAYRLALYIDSLKRELGQKASRAPMGVYF